jgi:O-acetylserine/cysteine efflux transporter
LKPLHTALALLTVSIWGFNFVVIRWGLAEIPPLLMGVLRFALAAFPLLLFYRLPRTHWRAVAAYAAVQFGVQFACLYSAMALGMPAGLTSLVIQCQALFTVVLVAGWLREPVRPLQWLGLGVALAGMTFAGWQVAGGSLAAVPVPAFLLVVLAGLGWAAGNVQLRRMNTVLKLAPLQPLALMAWASAAAVPPLLALSLSVEGWQSTVHALTAASWRGWGAAFFQAYGNTLLGYGVWSWLIGRYGAARVAPYSLLVPVVGMSCAAWFLGETLDAWKLGVFAAVIVGLGVNQFGAQAPKKQG